MLKESKDLLKESFALVAGSGRIKYQHELDRIEYWHESVTVPHVMVLGEAAVPVPGEAAVPVPGEAAVPVPGEAAVPAPYFFEEHSGYLLEDFVKEKENIIAKCDHAVRQLGITADPAKQEQIAILLAHKGVILGDLGRRDESLATYSEVERRFGASKNTALQKLVAQVFLNAGLALNESNRQDEALLTYKKTMYLFGSNVAHALQEPIARTLISMGETLSKLDRLGEALEAYDELLRRFRSSAKLDLQELVAQALNSKAILLFGLDEKEKAVEACIEVDRRFGSSAEPNLRGSVAQALANHASMSCATGPNQEALAISDDVVRRFGKDSSSVMLQTVAQALLCKASLLVNMDKKRDALEICDEMNRRFGASDDSALQWRVVWSMFCRGVILSELKGSMAALDGYASAVGRFEHSRDPEVYFYVTVILFYWGGELTNLNRFTEALHVYDRVIERFGVNRDSKLIEVATRAIVSKGEVFLLKLRKPNAALSIFQGMIDQFGEYDISAVQKNVAVASVFRGCALQDLERWDEAAAAYDEVANKFGSNSTGAVHAAWAVGLKGTMFAELNRLDEAVAAYGDLIRRFGTSADRAVRDLVAKASMERLLAFIASGRDREAVDAYNEIVDRFGGSNDNPADISGETWQKFLKLASIMHDSEQTRLCHVVLEEDMPVVGGLYGSGSRVGVWRFDGVEDQMVSIEVGSNAFKPIIELMSPTGGLVADARSDVHMSAHLKTTLAVSGWYDVRVGALGDRRSKGDSDRMTGQYELVLRSVSDIGTVTAPRKPKAPATRESAARTIRVWGLSRTEKERVVEWMQQSGIEALSELQAATDLLLHYLKRDRIRVVVRRPIKALGGDSLVDRLAHGDTHAMLAACREMFRFENAQA